MAKVMTKSATVAHMSGKLELTKKQVAAFMDELQALAVKEAKKSGAFVIPGIGKVVLSNRKARMGRNPQTGEPIKISERRVLTFKASQILKQALNPRNGNVSPPGGGSVGVRGRSSPSSGSPSTGASHHAIEPSISAKPNAMPPTPAALLGAMSVMIATHPPNTAITPIHVVARRRSPWPPTRPTTAPAAMASNPPRRRLSLPPSTMAPASVSIAPTATNGVAAPA